MTGYCKNLVRSSLLLHMFIGNLQVISILLSLGWKSHTTDYAIADRHGGRESVEGARTRV